MDLRTGDMIRPRRLDPEQRPEEQGRDSSSPLYLPL